MSRSTLVFWLCCIGILAACVCAEAKSYQLHVLGALDGCTLNAAADVNGSGVAVGFQGISTNALYCKWGSSGVRSLNIGASRSNRPRINDLGQIVSGAYFMPNGQTSSTTSLASVYGSYQTTNLLLGLNDSGEIAGQSIVNAQLQKHACLWDSSGPHDLGLLAGSTSAYATAINNSRVVAGSCTYQNAENRAFYWQSGHMYELPTAAGYDGSDAYAVNDSGYIVGRSHRYEGTGGTRQEYEVGCVWKDGVLSQLVYPGFSTRAYDINDSGAIVGFYYESDPLKPDVGIAFVWEDGVLTSLPGLGKSTIAYAINDAGWIAGCAFTATNVSSAVLWEPIVPEPSSILGLLAGVASLFATTRRRSA